MAASVSWMYSLIAVGVALIAVVLARSPDKGALVAGVYWLLFAVKSTVFSEIVIEGLFYPVYLAFGIAILYSLLRGGLRVVPAFFWSIVVFLTFVVVSLVGFGGAVDGAFVQRIVSMLVFPMIMLSIQSREGLRLVAVFGGIAGLWVATWVITTAAASGFEYRGDVDVNQNIVAFVLGVSLVVMVGGALSTDSGGWRRKVGLVLVSGVIAYALLLLASRGMTIAFAISVAAMVIHASLRDRRVLVTATVLMAVAGLGVLLPGGDGLLQRFEGESVSSAGDRTPIWAATLAALVDGDLTQLAVGNGFESSQRVVRDATAVHTSTHNAYLAMGFDYGLLGLLAFLTMHVVILVRAATLGSRFGTVATGVVWLLLGANLTTTTPDDFTYWLALGLAAACATVGSFGTRTAAA